ncbi:MAG TPA: ABC transporter substrate-binding protein [Candidatus Binatia bacterium]|jgi:putative ABC transport system substrate-binding protein
MKRKITVLTLSALLFALCVSVWAEQPKRIARIGWLTIGSRSMIPERYEAFRQGLRELGYIEGRNIVIERANAGGNIDRLADAAAELVRLNVDVIVTTGSTAVFAAKQATSTIPIVMTTGDPLATGIITSLARPGGNITGLTNVAVDLAGKRLELLKEAVPKLTRVGVLLNPNDPSSGGSLKETRAAARELGIQVQSLQVRSPGDFETAIKAASEGRVNALIILQNALINAHRARVVELAAKHQLPTMFGEAAQVESGGLMSYGPNSLDLFRRAATYVDKILKGAKPADLPVEQPTKFEFIINLKATKQIGLTIPPNVLARADKVIR